MFTMVNGLQNYSEYIIPSLTHRAKVVSEIAGSII
jgi:hypothetical protein